MTQQEFFNRYTYSVKSDRIGGGGFGTVYRATDKLLHRKVAIKVSEVKFFGDKEFSLKAEFDAVGKLPPHPNIAHYEELYSFESPQGVFDYAVMQFYEDGNLKNLIGQGGLTLAQKEQIARGILDGIAFLHSNKVVHRDLKPANILICREGDGYIPLITDFGLSKGVDEMSKSGFTNSIAGAGSLGYMSPEQFKNSRIQLNTDLWSYGVIVYELFSGRRLFQSALQTGASAEVQDMILHKDISQEIASLPDRWSKVAERCLVRDNRLRAKSADELYDVLGGSDMHHDSGSGGHEHLEGHDLPVAHNVDDSMSFGEAFASARQEVGPGGIFEWHGHSYGTYYKTEWDSMSADEGTVADNRVHVEPTRYSVVAKDKDDLKRIIAERIEKYGPNCDLNDIDVSNVTDMSLMFCESQFNGDISKWNVSNVTDMSDMFHESPFNGDISKWNVSNVTDMSDMFRESPFNGDISKWDVANVTDMSFMFSDSPFNGDISKWDVSNVTNMWCMFQHSQFNGDISKWNVSKVTDMSCMFNGSPFNGDISQWNVSKVTKMGWMFRKSQFNGNISKWDVSNVTDMSWMFYESPFCGDISKWDVSKVTDMSHMFRESPFNGDISKWNVSNVTDMRCMFYGSPFNGDISKWNVSNVTNMHAMFNGSLFNGDISKWDVSNVTDMSYLFSSSQFNGDISKWNVSNVTDMSGMFRGSQFNGDISKWNVSKVTDMSWMFSDSPFNGDISKWNVSNVTDMWCMFQHSQFNGDISKWDVSNVTDMACMFADSPFNGDISKWDVSNVTNMSGMFRASPLEGRKPSWYKE